MPNQSDPKNVQSDLPPLPLGAQTAPVNPVDQPANPSGTPPQNLPIISTPKKKFGGGRVIASILGFILLLGGIGAGLILTQQTQIFQQKAFIPEGGGGEPFLGNQKKQKDKESDNPVVVKRDKKGDLVYIQTNPDTTDNDCTGDGLCASGSCTNGACVSTSNSCKIGDPNAPGCCTNLNEADCDNVVCESGPAGGRKECKSSSGQHCTLSVGSSTGCGGANQPNTNISQTPNPTPISTPGSAQCLNVKAYSSTWTALTDDQLNKLTPNTVVNFCVTGSSSTTSGGNVSLGGSQGFDKGQFKINGVVKAETTTKRPSSNDFCQSYTILASDKLMDVKARIHHAALNQWFGAIF